jgi:hypothetical protein
MKRIIWKSVLPKTLPAPALLSLLPSHAKWLAGEGAGSWFVIDALPNAQFEISRYSPNGIEECRGVFETVDEFDPAQDFEMAFPSHCAKITVIQQDKEVKFNPKK